MKSEIIVKVVGISLMVFALAMNPLVVAELFADDKCIDSIGRVLGILIFEAAVFGFGLAVFIYSKEIVSKKKEILLLIIVGFLCFGVLEVGTRVYLCNFASGHVQSYYLLYGECGTTPTYSPHHYLSFYGTPDYKSGDGLNMHNSQGFRGEEIVTPKPDGVYRIVILGGSSAYTTGVADWREDWARQLQKELGQSYNCDDLEVINGALGGWNSWESLINLEFRVLDIEPDMIIIYHGVNDVHPRLTNPEFYRGDDSGVRKQWGKPEYPFIFRSAVVRITTGINPEAGLGAFVTSDTAAMVTKADHKDTRFNEKLGMTPMEALEENPPIYFERNLRNMIAIAEEHDVTVVLSTWAHSDQFDGYDASPHYEYAILEHNEVVKKVGKSHNIPVFDFATEMPIDKQYWSDGRHVNEEGAELKGRLFAQFIKENTIIK